MENAGNEFFLGFSSNNPRGSRTLQLFVTTTESSNVNFMVNASGFSFTGVAVHGSSQIVTLPSTLEVVDGSERNKGVFVKAEEDKSIIVYGLSYSAASSDAFLALPCSQLAQDSYEYFAVSFETELASKPAILVVACEDNTEVTVGSNSFSLDRLKTHLTESSHDLTGTRITSTKPISLFANHECAQVPVGTNYCDHLTEQIPPTTTWGRSFLAASFSGRNTEDIFRVVAAKSSTSVTVNCTTSQPVTYTLSAAGNWQQFTINRNSFCSITASASVLVAQYALGSAADQMNGMRIGDPLIMMLPPVEQFSNNYVFNSLQNFTENYVAIYVAPEYFQTDQIFVDSTNLTSSQWTPVYCSSGICGYITRMQLPTAGDHRLYHLDPDARLGMSVYGWNIDNSYGYPGGLKLTPVQCM